MELNYENKNSFHDSITTTAKNTLNFENSCAIFDYINNELENYKTSNRKLKYFDIIFITKYYDVLVDSATKAVLSPEQQRRYYRNPKLLSYDRYGVIDFWYLILLLNGWNSAYDMIDLNRSILMPNSQKVSEILTQEEFLKNNK